MFAHVWYNVQMSNTYNRFRLGVTTGSIVALWPSMELQHDMTHRGSIYGAFCYPTGYVIKNTPLSFVSENYAFTLYQPLGQFLV